ncbi:MAG: DUF3783 domain-containing protein [Desulfobacterales bacterium]|jgi:hypothetical protein|nr:DUF3783 domain-containing protein [Desulfobacterales bacterium]
MTEKSTFEKLTSSQQPLYGPRRLLLCGFGPEAQTKFATLLDWAGMADVPKVWATGEQGAAVLSELMALPDGSGAGTASSLPRAVIVGGITQAQLIHLMNACKRSGMRPPLWACLTPVSETWPLERLLAELARERAAMEKRRR